MSISGLAYGLGLLVGNIVSYFLFQLVPADWFLLGNSPALRLVMGVLLAFFISGLGGLLGGCIGGWSLPTIGQGKGRWGYIWRSGITFGFGYGLLLFPVILIIALLSFYDINSTPIYVFSAIFGLVGVIFGVIMGISLGLWTAGRRFSPITQWSTAGFSLGGLALGAAIWQFVFNIANGDPASGPHHWLLLGLFMFGGLGGIGLGLAYHRLAEGAEGPLLPIRSLSLTGWRRRWLIVASVLLVIALLIRPALVAIGDLLTPIDAGISPVLELPTIGTHWLDANDITTVPITVTPAIAANADGRVALVWAQDDALWLQEGQWQAADQQTTWQPAIIAAAGSAAEPTVALDADGRVYLAWAADNAIYVSQCQAGSCLPPAAIPPANLCNQPPELGDSQPTLAVSGETVLLVWANEAGILPYVAWSVAGAPQRTAAGCVPVNAAAPQLDNAFRLVYETAAGTIGLAQFDGADWTTQGELGNGRTPAITQDLNNQAHVALCTDDGLVYLADGQPELVEAGVCRGRPALAADNLGQIHVIWYGQEVHNTNGFTNPAHLIYHSVKTAVGWTPPAIVGQSQLGGQPTVAATGDGSLHLTWNGPAGLQTASQVQYTCDTADLSPLGQILYDVARQETYTPPGDPIPFCQNRYDQLLLTPNPRPEYGLLQPPTPNGAFDVMADEIRLAQYEVLFSTMWYDAPGQSGDSPGSVIASAVGDLYRSLQAHPEQYPRGLTVRLMLGNPPELVRGETSGQLWALIGDLRQAGIDKMVDEELGWRLEVADYEGNFPHSHVKAMVVDGKTAVTAGYNMTHDHFPLDHPSNRGGDRFDVGLQLTGPVAQMTLRMFDDMWQGADARHCLDLNPPLGLPWQATCYDRSAVADHVPEVLKFYLPGSGSAAFSMYRSLVHDKADHQIASTIAAAQETVDVIHVMFALDMICNLNVLFNVCNLENSPIYTEALVQAAQNGAHIRLLVKPGPVEGIENNIAMSAFLTRLQELGLEDHVELRFFNGPTHPKVVLIDDDVLIVGSQNLHYSAFGTGSGLNEHSLATDDPQAVADFKGVFEAEWARARVRP